MCYDRILFFLPVTSVGSRFYIINTGDGNSFFFILCMNDLIVTNVNCYMTVFAVIKNKISRG